MQSMESAISNEIMTRLMYLDDGVKKSTLVQSIYDMFSQKGKPITKTWIEDQLEDLEDLDMVEIRTEKKNDGIANDKRPAKYVYITDSGLNSFKRILGNIKRAREYRKYYS